MSNIDLEQLSKDIEDLKKAVKKNDPLLREMTAPPGWTLLGLFAGLAISLFALPAHVLSTQYGSFGAIPLVWKAALYCVLALFAVGGGIGKMVFLYRQAGFIGKSGALGGIFTSYFGGRFAHLSIPTVLAGFAMVAFAFSVGHPWYALPLSSLFLGVVSNLIADRSGIRSFYAIGYWCFGSSAAGLFFVESAPFLWLFAIYGGMFFCFAAAHRLESPSRKDKRA